MKEKIREFIFIFTALLVYVFSGFFLISFKLNPVIVTLFINLIFIVFSLYTLKKKKIKLFKKYERKDLIHIILGLIFSIIIWYLGQVWGIYALNNISDVGYNNYLNTLNSSVGLAIILVLFVAPICEEIFYRGLVYTSFKKIGGKLVSMFITAIVFSLMHGTIIHLIPMFLLSLILSVSFEKHNNITYLIFNHIFFNLLSPIFNGKIIVNRAMISLKFIIPAFLIVLMGIAFYMYFDKIKMKFLKNFQKNGTKV